MRETFEMFELEFLTMNSALFFKYQIHNYARNDTEVGALGLIFLISFFIFRNFLKLEIMKCTMEMIQFLFEQCR